MIAMKTICIALVALLSVSIVNSQDKLEVDLITEYTKPEQDKAIEFTFDKGDQVDFFLFAWSTNIDLKIGDETSRVFKMTAPDTFSVTPLGNGDFSILVLKNQSQIKLKEGKIFIFPFDAVLQFTFDITASKTKLAQFQAVFEERDEKNFNLNVMKNYSDKTTETEIGSIKNQFTFTSKKNDNDDAVLQYFTFEKSTDAHTTPLIYVLYREIHDLKSQAALVPNESPFQILNLDVYTFFYVENPETESAYYEYFLDSKLINSVKFASVAKLEAFDQSIDVNFQFTQHIDMKTFSVFAIQTDSSSPTFTLYQDLAFTSNKIEEDQAIKLPQNSREITWVGKKYLIDLTSQVENKYLNIYANDSVEVYLDDHFTSTSGSKLALPNKLYSEKFSYSALNYKYVRIIANAGAKVSVFTSDTKNVIFDSNSPGDQAIKLSLVGESARILYLHKVDSPSPLAFLEDFTSNQASNFSFTTAFTAESAVIEVFQTADSNFAKIPDSTKILSENTLIQVEHNNKLGYNFYLQPDFKLQDDRSVNFLSFATKETKSGLALKKNWIIKPIKSGEIVTLAITETPITCKYESPCIIDEDTPGASLISDVETEVIVIVSSASNIADLTRAVVGTEANVNSKSVVAVEIRKTKNLKRLTTTLTGDYSVGLAKLVKGRVVLPEATKQTASFEYKSKVLVFDDILIEDDSDLYLIFTANSALKVFPLLTLNFSANIEQVQFSYTVNFELASGADKRSASLVFISKDAEKFTVKINNKEGSEYTGNFQKLYEPADFPNVVTIVTSKENFEMFASSSSFNSNSEEETFKYSSKPSYKINDDSQYQVTWDKASSPVSSEYFLFYVDPTSTDFYSAVSKLYNEKYVAKVVDETTYTSKSPDADEAGYYVIVRETSTGRLALSNAGTHVFAKITKVEAGTYYKVSDLKSFAISSQADKSTFIGFVKSLFDTENKTGLTTDDKIKVAQINKDEVFIANDFTESKYFAIEKPASDTQYIVSLDGISTQVANDLLFYVISSDQVSLTLKDAEESSFYLGKDFDSATAIINHIRRPSIKFDIFSEIEISEIKLDGKSILPAVITSGNSFTYSYDVNVTDDNTSKVSIKVKNAAIPNLSLVKIYIQDAIIRFSKDAKEFPIHGYPSRIEGVSDNFYIELSDTVFPTNTYLFTNFALVTPKSIEYNSNELSKVSDFDESKVADASIYIRDFYIAKKTDKSKFLIRAKFTPDTKTISFTQQHVQILATSSPTAVDTNGLKVFSLPAGQTSITFVSEGKIRSVGVSYTSDYLFNQRDIDIAEQYISIISTNIYTVDLTLLDKFNADINSVTVLADLDSSFYITTEKVTFEDSIAGNFYFAAGSTQYYLIKKETTNDIAPSAHLRVAGTADKVAAKILFVPNFNFDPKSPDFKTVNLNESTISSFPTGSNFAVVRVDSTESGLVGLTFNAESNASTITRSSYYSLRGDNTLVVKFTGQLTYIKIDGIAFYDDGKGKKTFEENVPIISVVEQTLTLSVEDPDKDVTFFLNAASKITYTVVKVSEDPAVKTIIKPNYNVLNFSSKENLLKKLIVLGSETSRTKLSVSVLDKQYDDEKDTLYLQTFNHIAVNQKDLYSFNFHNVNNPTFGLLVYSDNVSDIEVKAYEINNSVTKALADYSVFTDLSLDLILEPKQVDDTNLIVTLSDPKKKCKVNKKDLNNETYKFILDAASNTFNVECTEETQFKAAAFFTSNKYTDEELNPSSKFEVHLDSKSTAATLQITLAKAFLSSFSKEVSYTLMFQDNKASDKVHPREFKLSDYLGKEVDPVKRLTLAIKDNKLEYEITLLDYEREFDYAVFAEDKTSGLIMVYDSSRANLKVKEDSTPSSGLAWYYILIIVLGGLILVGLIFFLVKKFACKSSEESETETEQNLV